MIVFNTASVIVQIIKISLFFLGLGLPLHGDLTGFFQTQEPVASIRDVERPASNPRRKSV